MLEQRVPQQQAASKERGPVASASLRQADPHIGSILKSWESLSEEVKLELIPHLLSQTSEWNRIRAKERGQLVSMWLMVLFHKAGLKFF
jgi:hypothetical protein